MTNYDINTIQANILKAHGRNHVWCLFIRFNIFFWKHNSILARVEAEIETYRKEVEEIEIKIKLHKDKLIPELKKKKQELEKVENKEILEEVNIALLRYKKQKQSYREVKETYEKRIRKLENKKSEIERSDRNELEIENAKKHQGNIRKWISDFAEKHVTPLTKQIRDSEIRNAPNYKEQLGEKYDGGLLASIFISADGYRILGKEEKIEELGDECFSTGMKSRKTRENLNDISYLEWEDNYRNPIHAMIKLADNSLTRLNKKTNLISDSLAKENKIGQVIFTEMGRTYSIDGMAREHFGYADGVSKRKLLKNNNEVNELGNDIVNEYGESFLVYRKLEQNVAAFNLKVSALAKKLSISKKFAGAQIIGRYKEGVPLTVIDDKGKGLFRFSGDLGKDDKKGNKCPFHAHIRKANPRTDTFEAKIFRQGITYGERASDFSDQPQNGVGLLFMSFQKNIKEFENIQRRCNNVAKLPNLGVNDNKWAGLDPLIGQYDKKEEKRPNHWNKKWGDDRHNSVPLDFDDLIEPSEGIKANASLVTLKGGEYFHAPSIHYLKTWEIQSVFKATDLIEASRKPLHEVSKKKERKQNAKKMRNCLKAKHKKRVNKNLYKAVFRHR